MHKSKSILASLYTMMLLPLIIVGVILSFFVWRAVYGTACDETRNTLSVVAHAAVDELNLIYPGEVKLTDDSIMKGEQDFVQAHEILDAFHENNQVEIDVYFDGKSILSTRLDETGEMLYSKPIPSAVQNYVCEKGLEYYSDTFLIDSDKYIVYAIPLTSSNKDCVVVMQSLDKIKNDANTIVFKIFIVIFITILIASAVCVFYANSIGHAVKEIKAYLGSMVDRAESGEMKGKVLDRQDEIGEIGRYAITVNEELSKLISCDPLTELYNRRAARARFAKRLENKSKDKDLTVAMGDIDFFKKINDTYGHECGDIVLKKVAEVLKLHMKERGFAARWGGEEFLLVFDKNFDITCDKVHMILDKIRELKFEYDDKEFQITMTFGVQTYKEGMDMDEMIRLADEKLYYGKENGRNCVVTE